MAMQVNVMPDLANKRANVNIYDPQQQDSVSMNFPLNLTGNETLNQAQQMAKDRAKQILQDAIAAL